MRRVFILGAGMTADNNAVNRQAAVATAIGDYKTRNRRRAVLIIVAGCVLAALVLIDIMTGPAGLSAAETFQALVNPSQTSASNRIIVWTFRLPTALMAILVGCSLGVAGVQMQTILNNPLASPFTLGVSAGAGFGAALAIICGAALIPMGMMLLVPLSAFAFAMLCSMAIYGLAQIKRGSMESIILGGVALLFLFNAGVAFMQYVASENQLQAIVFWTFGSLQGATWPKVAVIGAVILFVAPLLAFNAWPLTALRLGDARAHGLGIDVKRLRLRVLILTSVLTATAVCFTGTIGFIGLVAPHIARMLVGEDQRYLMPLSALAGGVLLSAASVVSKAVVPGTIFPIGIITSFIGVPFFASLIIFRRKAYW